MNAVKRGLLATVITGLVLAGVFWAVCQVSGFFYTEILVVIVASSVTCWKTVYREI